MIHRTVFALLISFPAIALSNWAVEPNPGGNKFIYTQGSGATVSMQCIESTPVLHMTIAGKYTAVTPYVDNQRLDFIRQTRLRDGSFAMSLTQEGLSQIFSGQKLVIHAIKLLGDDFYAGASLIGFTKAFNNAGIGCDS